jgi:ubiquinone/menaquinone biosynthesis C-methylase UbiE
VSFDRIAPHYQFFETIAFGHALQRARTAFISQIRDDQRVLLVGEGDGRFLAELLRRKPEIEIDCVDASAAMIQSARARAAVIASTARDLASGHKRLASSVGPSRTGVVCALRDDASLQLSELTRVQFHHADILDWVPPQKSYDLVVTHFFLDCFNRNQLSGVIAKLERAAAPRARWLVADFAIPPNGFRHIHAKIWLRAMYSFFGVVADLEANDLVDPSPFIRAAGFQLHREVVTRFGLIKSQVWERSS